MYDLSSGEHVRSHNIIAGGVWGGELECIGGDELYLMWEWVLHDIGDGGMCTVSGRE